ncbi:hypothetical protein [Paraflavitalea sp. CAU 1676]|uniref:hypothetical protein n=1 Tax=Paraflavitalea sp. CAU 1676 TaxID=3032598 RepID=UPI0023DC616E|nr:hypothetical protein [Paraflavitalea sp. CAU 1676]MDF2189409.1 hypothetical protein [Paraflavitalea sp. CAU 1676]
MNQVFDFQRYSLLVRKHWGDNRNKYLLSLGAIASLLLLWYGFLILVDGHGAMAQDAQAITYYVGLFLTGSFYASTLFADLANKPKGINFLAVPASQLEKTLVMFLYCVIIFFVCYTCIFYAVDFIMVKVGNAVEAERWRERHIVGSVFTPHEIANVFYKADKHNSGNPFATLTIVLLLFFAVQGAYALGSIYFPAYSFIKVTITILLLILFFIFLVAKVLYPILPKGGFSNQLTEFNLYIPGKDWASNYIQLPTWTDNVLFGFFKYVIAPVFWIATYFRLKEKEV